MFLMQHIGLLCPFPLCPPPVSVLAHGRLHGCLSRKTIRLTLGQPATAFGHPAPRTRGFDALFVHLFPCVRSVASELISWWRLWSAGPIGTTLRLFPLVCLTMMKLELT